MSEGIEWLNELHLLKEKRILCLVDGEHYPPVTEWALKKIEQKGGKITGLVFAGGTEKISSRTDSLFSSLSYPLYIRNRQSDNFFDLLKQAADEEKPEVVVDLSDDPVVTFKKRFKIASILLNRGITYTGADFVFTPPSDKKMLDKPAITIFGAGKRVGKTAASITISRILKHHGIKPAVVAMGRGGPAEPQVVLPDEVDVSPDLLLDIARKGDHAASDYWENALLSRIPAIGCRRCGGGMAGNPFISNVAEGARKASELPVDLVIMEGSGPTLPPVKTNGKIVVIDARKPLEDITAFFNEYRLLLSDLAIITMCEEPLANPQKIDAIKKAISEVNPDIELAFTVFRPDPLGDIRGKKVFLATTAPAGVIGRQIELLEQQFECRVTGYSTNLSNRKLLRQDLQKLNFADVLLTEIKAASIDVAAKTACENNLNIVFLHNNVKLIDGTVDTLDEAILNICKQAGVKRKIIK